MHRRIPLMLLFLFALLAAACQNLDSDAASGSLDEGEDPPVALDTPPIELPNGDTTADPCVLTSLQATDILTKNCSGCHGGGSPGARQGQPPFDYVLDTEALKGARSASVPDPLEPDKGMRFLRPGDPENSRLFVRVAGGEMPPELPIGVDPIPRPTLSDASLLYNWIQACVK